MKTSVYEGEVQNKEPERCDDLSWFEINKLPVNIVPYIKQAIDCYLDGKSYCEFGWEARTKTNN